MLKCSPLQRDEAWRIKPYPCIGQYTFIHTPMYGQSVYWDILSRLKEGSIFLDVGTCFGQELRRLLADGAPNQNMFAVDLSSEFWELGYRLFKDRGRIHAKLIIADILAKGNGGTELETLVGKIDIIHAGSFFHLFDWNDQVAALKKLVMLSRVGALLVGHHIGRKPAKCTLIRGEPRYYHDEESWRKIWKETEEATGTEWMIDVEVGKHDILGLKQEDFAWMGPFARALRFVAIRRT